MPSPDDLQRAIINLQVHLNRLRRDKTVAASRITTLRRMIANLVADLKPAALHARDDARDEPRHEQ
jgi:hypothetical protein